MDHIFLVIVLVTLLIATASAQSPTTQLRFYNSTTELPHNNRIVPHGTTVLLECRVTPHQQQTYYQWTCPHPPCDGEYRRVYNNLILIIATYTTSGQYKCTPTPQGNKVSATLTVHTSLTQDTLVLYNRSKLLLRNTLITDPQQIPNGLVCTTSVSGGQARFRFEDETVIHGSRQGQSTTVQSSQLNQNGRYVCYDGRRDWPFYIYFNNATLPTPQVSQRSSDYGNQLRIRLVLCRPEGYNSGRFILRYDCGFRGIPIELEYRTVDINSGSSDAVVRRSRSCFVVGEISRVTVWFVSGGHISSTPAVVNANSGEVQGSPQTTPQATTHPSTTDVTRASTQPTTTASCPPHIPVLPLNSVILTPLTHTVPPGTTLTIGCVDGYYTDQMGTMTCGTDGQWTGTPTQCTETCKASNLTAVSEDAAYTIPNEIRPGAVATSPRCREGYHVTVSAVCQDDRTWRVEEQCVQSETSGKCPTTNTGVIVAVTIVNIIILLLTISLLVILVTVLTVKGKKQPLAVNYTEESTGTAHFYEEGNNNTALKKPPSKVYQELDFSKMEEHQYATMK